MLIFYKIDSVNPAAKFVAEKIIYNLNSGKKVLWLVAGGSSIKVAADVSKLLYGHDLKNLTVTLTDERFGKLSHPDSNWLQLEKSGFRLQGADLRPVLDGRDMSETVKKFDDALKLAIRESDYRLGLFGIGSDGHTAGILPGSPAVTAEDFAVSYDAGEFKRITTTPQAIMNLDEAVIYAVGEPKWPILDQLETRIDISLQPAQTLKKVPKLTIFNDYKGAIK